MPVKTLVVATALAFGITGAAWAQTPAGGGSAEGNMNNPASVKSNSEKREERATGSATGTSGAMSDPTMAPAAGAPAATGSTTGTGSPSGAR
jgi:hypothetical protein